MDKIPKLRRKPKPPAIETRVERTSTDTSESNISNNASAAGAPILADTPSPRPPSGLSSPRTQSPAGRPATSEGSRRRQQLQQHLQQQPTGKRSPFRGLRLRASAKRARESSPAHSSSPPPTLPPIAHNDAVKMPENTSDDDNDVFMDNRRNDLGPIMPYFLRLADRETNSKFEDINWDERMRVTKGQASDSNLEPEFGMFKQTNAHEKGLMDRYINIKPWNHNRVKLNVPEGELDYVNASAIHLISPSDESRPPFRYIAMQGPTEPSIPYVWRMIAEQVESPGVIIQLTNNIENGAQKCGQYFPDSENAPGWVLNGEDVWRDGWNATLKYESAESLCHGAIEKRRLSLQVDGEDEPRAIWHFWYRRWPDFAVPDQDDLESFYEMMRLSREHSSPKGPRIVHCSAGVGRTGTFIALEHLIRELDVGALCDPVLDRRDNSPTPIPDLIFKTVSNLRQQRRGMVQTVQQYQFLYQVLKKLWLDKYGPNEDEDEADGGVDLAGHTWEADNDDDDDEGGAKVRSEAPTPTAS